MNKKEKQHEKIHLYRKLLIFTLKTKQNLSTKNSYKICFLAFYFFSVVNLSFKKNINSVTFYYFRISDRVFQENELLQRQF